MNLLLKLDFLNPVSYLTGTWSSVPIPISGSLHCFNTVLVLVWIPVWSCPDMSSVQSSFWLLIFLIAFLTSSCDITQIWVFHTHLSHWSSLPSVTFFFLSDTPWTADCTNHTPTRKHTLCLLTHPKALLLSSRRKTSGLIANDYADLFRIGPLTLNMSHSLQPLSIKTCYSNSHLLYSPLICSSCWLQQVGLVPSAVWNLTLWESNGGITNLPGEGPEPQSTGTRLCHLILGTHAAIILPNMPPPHQLHLHQPESSLPEWQQPVPFNRTTDWSTSLLKI